MQVAKTNRVPAGELKVGDVLVIPVCPSIDALGDPYGGSSVILETIIGIEPCGDYGGLKFKTRWRMDHAAGNNTYRYSKYSFVTKL